MIREFSFSNLAEIVTYTQNANNNPQLLNFLENGKWVSFSSIDFVNNVKNLAVGLKEIGLHKGNSVGNLSHPNPIWLMMDFAIISSGAVSVPIFANISHENLVFEIENSAIKFIFCDSKESLKNISKTGKNFTKIIIYGFEAEGENIIKFSDLLKTGEKINHDGHTEFFQRLVDRTKEDDLATIIYTSGSTGTPKGVEITHKNLITQIKSARKRFPFDAKTDVALSFLPLAHIFERMIASYYIASGISIYFADDPKNAGNLMKEVRPTVMTVVPRVLEKVYAKIRSGVDEGGLIKKFLGNLAINFALKADPKKCSLRKLLFNILVYKKIRQALGGRMRLMICGGAALSIELDRFFKNIGVNLFVGYGLTETSPVIAVNYPENDKVGTVGKVFDDVKIKTDKDGELLVKGPNVMRSYHKADQKTKEVFDADGWFRTGDLAKIDQEGFITITGRKKELFKTATGKYVSPVPIEQKLMSALGFLLGACIIAEARKFTSCIIIPDFEILPKYKAKFGMQNLSDEEFLQSNFLKEKVEAAVNLVNRHLNDWEQIKKYYVAIEAASIETGELTPSMKLKRNAIEAKYKEQIDQFYQ